MSIKIVCDQCGIEKRVNDRFAGRRVRCPECESVLRVPEASPGPEKSVDSVAPEAKPPAPSTSPVPSNSPVPSTSPVPEAPPVPAAPPAPEASTGVEASTVIDATPVPEASTATEAASPSVETEDAWAAAVGSGETIADPASLAPPGSTATATTSADPPAETSEADVTPVPGAAVASPAERSPATQPLATAVAAATSTSAAAAEDDEEEADEVLVRSKKPEEEMDMTPMVDVTFLLLIFFMVTAAFSLQKSIEMPRQQTEAPSVSNVEEEDETETVDVEVDENGSFLVLAPDWERETPGKQNLVAALREASAGKSEPMKLNVKVHEMAKVKAMVDAMDAGTIANYTPILITQVDGFD